MHVSPADESPDTPLQSTLRLLMGELSRHQIGSHAAAERLIEVLFVHVIRSWLATSADSTPPLLANWTTRRGDRACPRIPPRPARTRVDDRRARRRCTRLTIDARAPIQRPR